MSLRRSTENPAPRAGCRTVRIEVKEDRVNQQPPPSNHILAYFFLPPTPQIYNIGPASFEGEILNYERLARFIAFVSVLSASGPALLAQTRYTAVDIGTIGGTLCILLG